MPPANPQYRNAGNLGDVLKHAALVRLADLLASRNASRPLHWLDTHTFLLNAPFEAGADWRDTVDAEARRFPAYRDYEAAEEPFVSRGVYRCSTGLVASRLPAARLHLAESDEPTRAVLEAQLSEEGRTIDHLLSDAQAYRTVKQVGPAGAVLALVDPFSEPGPFWDALDAALAVFRDPGADVIVLTFAYGRKSIVWPRPPAGCVGPVAVVERLPYGLVVYASVEAAASVRDAVAGLGWRPTEGLRRTS